MTPDDETVLDNLVWHALNGPHADLAEADTPTGTRRYVRSVAMFSAVDRLDEAGWAALGQLVGPEGVAVLFRDEVPEAPAGWTEVFRGRTVQYVAEHLVDPDPALAAEIVELGLGDADDMVALTGLTEPGPFNTETWRAGRYFGLRRDGRLLAMAGERLRAPGWGEVSAVCVHPSARGLGLGAALTLAAAGAIAERGDRPMLHVADRNDPAHALYLKLGFAVRRDVEATAHRFTGG